MTYNLIRTWGMLVGILLSSMGAWAHEGDKTIKKDTRDSLRDSRLQRVLTVDSKTHRNLPQLENYIQNAQSAFSIPFESLDASPEFTPQYIAQNYTVSTEIGDARAQAQATLDEIDRKGSYTDNISPKDLVELPIGMKKKLGNSNVILGVSKAKFLPEYTLLTIFCRIDLPQGKSIFFGADSIKLSHKGGLIGGGNLVLLGDFQIPINGNNMMITLKGGLDMKTGNIQNLTYVKMECNGVKELGITADVSFPRNLLVPLTSDYKVEPNEQKKVQGTFSTTVTDWNDITADLTLPLFAIKGMERIAFKLDKAIFDMSDLRTSNLVEFPMGYANFPVGRKELWRGVYIREFEVILPKEFKDRKANKPVSFKAERLLIDNTGISGIVSGTNILETGSASGWDFSIEKFEIELQSNSLRRAGFNGAIAIPVSKKQNETDSVKKYGLAYRAVFLSSSDYLMNVSLKDSLSFDLWKAKALIKPGSYVELVNKNEQFKPKAVLTGELNLNIAGAMSLSGISFQELTIQTEEPYLSIKGGGFKLENKARSVANFPITVKSIEIRVVGNEAMIAFDTISINLMEGKISAKGSVAITGEFNKVDDRFDFKFKGFNIGELAIGANFSGFTLDGKIKFFDKHFIMGTGFGGSLSMTVGIGGGKDIKIDAKASFGKKETYRYWYVDAMASGFKIPVGGVFNITGLGGGASYHMMRHTSVQNDSLLKECPSGIGFIPDNTIGLGFRAMAAFNVGTDRVAQGDVTLEMLFNANTGGVARIGLYGKATILPSIELLNAYNDIGASTKRLTNLFKSQSSAIQIDTAQYNADAKAGKFKTLAVKSSNELETVSQGSIFASVGIEYDFNRKALDANFDVTMNVAGGLITGGGAAKMHFEANRWYIFLGTSERGKELNVKFDIGIGAVDARTYFMVGDSIGSSPPPPTEIASILGRSVEELNYMRDQGKLGTGGGLAFGAHLSTEFKASFGKIFSFYAEFKAGIGFDIMIKRYLDKDGNPAYCKNDNGRSPLGIKGWYANGQAYAYLQGALGIEVDVLFVTKKIDIISAGAAVLLQAKGPNPTWMAGYLGGRFSILGGFISGSFSCKVSFGSNCEVQGTNPINERVEFITKIIPEDRTEGVDPLGTVQAFFKYPLEKPFYLAATGDGGEQIEYDKTKANGNSSGAASIFLKAYRDKFQLISRLGNVIEPRGVPVLSSDGLRIEYPNHSALASNDSITAIIEIYFKFYNGTDWVDYLDENGQRITQKKEITFKTAKQPKNIPLSNIVYTYPVVDQKFFYPQEHDKGFIKLKRSQKYLFPVGSTLKLTFKKPNSTPIEVPVQYDDNTKQFNYNMPLLEKGQSYTLNISAQKPNATLVSNILTHNFNTSVHNTFSEKLTKYKPKYFYSQQNMRYILTGNGRFGGRFIGFILNTDIEQIEPFDLTEISGSLYSGSQSLISPISPMTDSYYQDDIKPFMGDAYNSMLLTRDTSTYGVPPSRAIIPFLSGQRDSLVNSFPYMHAVSSIFAEDLEDFKRQLFKRYVPDDCKIVVSNSNNYYNNGGSSGSTQTVPYYCFTPNNLGNCNFCCDTCRNAIGVPYTLKDLYTKALPELREGQYDVNFRYILPNGFQTSTPVFSYYHVKNNSIETNAGADQIKTVGTFTLNAQGSGTGSWSIAKAPSGFSISNISDINSPYATLKNVPTDSEVILQWNIRHSSGAYLSDAVSLIRVSGAKAGDDINSTVDTFALNGNAHGKWTIISEEDCVKQVIISNNISSNPYVTGMPINKPITLRWTLDDGTGTLYDDVVLTRQLPSDMAGLDIVQYDSTFTISAKTNNGIWSVNGNSYATISDTTAQQTQITLSEPNKLITIKRTLKDAVCNQVFEDEATLLWVKADLGSDQCFGIGNFTVKGYGTGTWSITDKTEGVNILIDSFASPFVANASIFNMPVDRLPKNGFITLKWTLPNGEFDEVVFRRTTPIDAGPDQSKFDSVFTMIASGGSGVWSIASAPISFSISNISDIYDPTTNIILPPMAVVKLVWRIEDGCVNGTDTVILKRTELGNLLDGLTDSDKATDQSFSYAQAKGEGKWSIAYLPIGSDTTGENNILLGELIYNYVNIWLSKIPLDSSIILQWTSRNGDYDFMKITRKKTIIVKAKLFLEQFYNPQLGYMVRPSNLDSLIKAAYPTTNSNSYINNYFKQILLSDSTIVYPIGYYACYYACGGTFIFLKQDGTIVENYFDKNDNILMFRNDNMPYSQQTEKYSGKLRFSALNCIYQNDILIGDPYQNDQTIYSDLTEFVWGNEYSYDFTNGSVQNPNLIQKPHPTRGTVYVLKKP
jgi:hypothetical protein